MDNNFIKDWIEDVNNIQQLENIFAHYIEFDKDNGSLKIIIKVLEEES